MSEDVSIVYRQKAERLYSELQKVETVFPEVFNVRRKAAGQYVDFTKNPEIQVAIVGAVKAGKSTLLNAILGDDITSTEVTPETAALTIFKYSERNYIKVSFYNKKDWKDLWDSANEQPESPFFKEYKALDAESIKDQWIGREELELYPDSMDALKVEVKKFSSSQSAAHYFVKKLEIGLSQFGLAESPLPRALCFVDTPGLYDVVAYRANITRDYIDRANAVIVCVNSSTMRAEEYKTIQKTFENIGDNKNKVIILGTQIDRLNNPKEEWEKLKRNWHKYLEVLYKDPESMKTNIIGVSSVVFSRLQKLRAGSGIDKMEIRDTTTFAEKNGIEIVPANKTILDKLASLFSSEQKIILKKADQILQCTNIYHFLEVMKSGPLSEPAKLLADDLSQRYNFVVSEARETAENQKKAVEEQLSVLNQDRAKIQAKIDMKKQEQAEIQASGEKIKNLLSDMEKEIIAEVGKMKNKLNSAMEDVLGGK